VLGKTWEFQATREKFKNTGLSKRRGPNHLWERKPFQRKTIPGNWEGSLNLWEGFSQRAQFQTFCSREKGFQGKPIWEPQFWWALKVPSGKRGSPNNLWKSEPFKEKQFWEIGRVHLNWKFSKGPQSNLLLQEKGSGITGFRRLKPSCFKVQVGKKKKFQPTLGKVKPVQEPNNPWKVWRVQLNLEGFSKDPSKPFGSKKRVQE